MPIPTNKSQLVVANSEGFEEVNRLIDSFSVAQREESFQFPHRDRNVRDVVAHVLEWQSLFFEWYKNGMRGDDVQMPKTGFTWKDTPKLNLEIWENVQSITLSQVRTKLKRSHEKLQKLIEKHTNEELFGKKIYPWTGTTSLAVYIRGAGCSHYGWALKLL